MKDKVIIYYFLYMAIIMPNYEQWMLKIHKGKAKKIAK